METKNNNSCDVLVFYEDTDAHVKSKSARPQPSGRKPQINRSLQYDRDGQILI